MLSLANVSCPIMYPITAKINVAIIPAPAIQPISSSVTSEKE